MRGPATNFPHLLWSCMWKSFQHMQCVKVSVSTSCFNLIVLRLVFSPLVSFSCVPRCFTSPWLPAASPLIFVVPCVSSSCVSSHRFAPALRYDSQQQNSLWVLNLTFRDLSLGPAQPDTRTAKPDNSNYTCCITPQFHLMLPVCSGKPCNKWRYLSFNLISGVTGWICSYVTKQLSSTGATKQYLLWSLQSKPTSYHALCTSSSAQHLSLSKQSVSHICIIVGVAQMIHVCAVTHTKARAVALCSISL